MSMSIPMSNVPVSGSRGNLQERSWKVTGSCRKAPEIAGTWKQYSERKFSDFFPVNSSQFPAVSSRNRPELSGKKSENFRSEYCFHVPAISGIFLPEPARTVRLGDECVEFILSNNHHQVYLIISDAIGQYLVRCIHDIPQLHSIFVFCQNKSYHQQ